MATTAWDETKHPRGQPENAGQFSSKPQSPKTGAEIRSEARTKAAANAKLTPMDKARKALSGQFSEGVAAFWEQRLLMDTAIELDLQPWDDPAVSAVVDESPWDAQEAEQNPEGAIASLSAVRDWLEKQEAWQQEQLRLASKETEGRGKNEKFRDAVRESFEMQLEDPEKAADYAKTFADVAMYLTGVATTRVLENTNYIRAYRDLDDLNVARHDGDQHRAAQQKAAGRIVGGFYRYAQEEDGTFADGSLHLNGGYEGQPWMQKEIYAHEVAHAIDGLGHKLSNNGTWVDAWRDEIKSKGELSDYAGTNPHEGWAEFGRLILTHRGVEARHMFPRCYAFWASKGLI